MENAGRGLRALARASTGFLTASWDGRYRPSYAGVDQGAGVNGGRYDSSDSPLRRDPRSAEALLRPIAEPRVTHPISSVPIAFMRSTQFSSRASHALHAAPVFAVEAREQSKKQSESTVTSLETKFDLEYKNAAEDRLATELEQMMAKRCEEFSIRLDQRLDSFYAQTASRLEAASQEILAGVCEVLNRDMAKELRAAMSGWAEKNRTLVNAECQAALNRFADNLENIASCRIESHRKEIQHLSAKLKTRLRGVAHALEELDPATQRSSGTNWH